MNDKDRDKSRYEILGFKPQKEIIYNKLLPYANKLDEESLQLWTDIKTNLAKSIMLREIRPGCVLWTSRLNKYMKVYGLKFSKDDHIALIKLMYELITIPNLEPTRVNKFATTLTHLLKKFELLSPDELELPWRPLYELCKRIIQSSESSLGMYRYFSSLENSLDYLVHASRIYFPASATQEMLDEWRPMLCPYDNTVISSTIGFCEWFLPIAKRPSEASITYELWLHEFMSFWEICHNAATWEVELMWLMARLANHNIGYINWEPYLPLMFTRFLRCLDLPVSYRQKQSTKHHKIEITPIACWIVASIGGGSSTLKYLEKFMQTLESYYHPANVGRWGLKLRELLRKLSYFFIQRLHKERYKKLTWETPVPDSHKITEAEIDKFMEIMKPIISQAIYSRQGTSDVSQALQYLATIRPNIIVPLVLNKIYSTLDSLTEPHKLTASMQCLIAVARPMVQGPNNGYRDGPTHVIPLLMALLPGIDPNDIGKCFVTFQFVSTFIVMIPLMDSSGASDFYSDLTEEEHAVCEATAGFEDFVLQLFDRVFALIENSSMEATRLEQVDLDKRSKLEAMAQSALSSICNIIAAQTSSNIFKSALRKLHTFVRDHILEIKVSGHTLAIICRSFARVNAEDTLRLLVPHLCERIEELLGDTDDIQKEERLDNELLYNLCILSEMFDCNGTALLPYIDRLIKILDRTLHLTCQQGSVMASRLLDCILSSLTIVQPTEFRSIPPPFCRPVEEYLPIREWGKSGNINNLDIQWYQPGEQEITCVQMLLNRYLPPELECLESYINGSVNLTREELRRTLNIVLAVLGSQTVLPMWQEPAIQLIPSKLKPWAFEMIIGTTQTVTMPDGSNVRHTLVNVMHRLQKKILKSAEDDTKSLFALICIWDTILMNRFRLRDFEIHWKNFHVIKKLMEDRLRGNKGHLRQLLVDRAMLHQEFRTEIRSCTFTETHRQIIIDLYTLSISHYSEVRIRAQKKLFSAVASFPYSYSVLTPYIKRSLQMDSNTNHEEFKGCLYVLLGPKNTPIITRHDWTFVNEIWPVLVNSKPSEKQSVINLMAAISEAVHKNFPTISMKVEVPDSCIEAAKALGLYTPKFKQDLVDEDEVREGIATLVEISEKNKTLYNSILDSLLNSMKEGNLHWRFNNMALGFIRDLVHPEMKYSEKLIKHVLQILLHDNLELRKLAIRVTLFILRQHKKLHKKIQIDPYSISGVQPLETIIPGSREDNLWMQYNSKTIPLDSAEWDKPRFVHKQYVGYYTWAKTIEIYAPYSEQEKIDRSRDELSIHEQEVYDFFMNPLNIERLIKYLSMEEKKGKDKFNANRFIMFKNLFRNYGDTFLPYFVPHLERLVKSKEEHDQRAAAEIISGIIRGSKHWPFDKTKSMWDIMDPILRTAMSNMTVETVTDWGVCCATASVKRDPNKYHWLFELLMENPLRSDEASYIECGRLFMLQGALSEQAWRIAELSQRLFIYLKDYLTHPFQNVRERISSVLTTMFETDILFPGGIESGPNAAVKGPRIADFMAEVIPKLNVLYAAGVKDINHTNHLDIEHASEMLNNVKLSDNERDVAIRLFKTVSKWVINSISRINFGAVPEFYQLVPLACLLQSYEADEELSIACSSLLAMLSQALTLSCHIPVALKTIRSVAESGSWSARAASAEYIQVFVFHNMATILSNDDWVLEIKNIVLTLINDDQPEVRIQASQVLGGLLHCQFIPSSKELLNLFKKKAKTRLKQLSTDSSDDSTIRRTQHRAVAVRTRHTGVLGMCAFINAHPYDVPDYLPDVFLELGAHLNDPQPIPTTIRKTLGDFKRTHHDNWEVHKLKFTEDELGVLSDLTVPPSYYA